MTTQNPGTPWRERAVGDIATVLPAATGVFRGFKIDFFCNGNLTLDCAAQQCGVDPMVVERALNALSAETVVTASPAAMSSDALIDHIRARYHDAHRRALPDLIALAQKVEAVHRGNPRAPAGLSDVLLQMTRELLPHMVMEETLLFPAMRQRSSGRLDLAIGELRHEHDGQGALLRLLESLTDDFTVPDGACHSWKALYIGAAQLAEDLMEHIHLENNVLFPRFTPAEGRSNDQQS